MAVTEKPCMPALGSFGLAIPDAGSDQWKGMARKRYLRRYNCVDGDLRLARCPLSSISKSAKSTSRMTEASLAFTDPDQIIRLFGAQDRYLRQVRDVVGVDVTLRGDEIRLHGTDEQI